MGSLPGAPWEPVLSRLPLSPVPTLLFWALLGAVGIGLIAGSARTGRTRDVGGTSQPGETGPAPPSPALWDPSRPLVANQDWQTCATCRRIIGAQYRICPVCGGPTTPPPGHPDPR